MKTLIDSTFVGLVVAAKGVYVLEDLIREHEERMTLPSPDQTATSQELRERLVKVLKSLRWRERLIIELRYGMGDGYIYTLEEVGHIFKVTRERVRQIERKALRKLRLLLDPP